MSDDIGFHGHNSGYDPGTICMIIKAPTHPENIGKIVTVLSNVPIGGRVPVYTSEGVFVHSVLTMEVVCEIDKTIPGAIKKDTNTVLYLNFCPSAYLMPLPPLEEKQIKQSATVGDELEVV